MFLGARSLSRAHQAQLSVPALPTAPGASWRDYQMFWDEQLLGCPSPARPDCAVLLQPQPSKRTKAVVLPAFTATTPTIGPKDAHRPVRAFQEQMLTRGPWCF
jgi:hypothetical protein